MGEMLTIPYTERSEKIEMLTCWFVRLRMAYRILCIWASPVIYRNSRPAIVASTHDAPSSRRQCIYTVESTLPFCLYRSKSSSLCAPKTIVLLPLTFAPAIEMTNSVQHLCMIPIIKKKTSVALTLTIEVLATGSICLLSNLRGFKIHSCSGAIEFHRQHGNHNANPTSNERNTMSYQFRDDTGTLFFQKSPNVSDAKKPTMMIIITAWLNRPKRAWCTCTKLIFWLSLLALESP